ncbi:MAG: DUF3082 domain-containing protein [Leptolyngbyaceae cyanobacterium SM1_1_3]|nr:DUF3082 domain-containing protein [Leptolyngbyaceae cyanobacterium SM1_1_3]NJN01059.1 DUF3082 domain-containing protein [Leptolyngbyaceae cyanobacterium RM1_1_2]NJO11942.1 DUF3082 domain-containing protein [Leptolyngbyaceae cyanobacterium SL_1_1]
MAEPESSSQSKPEQAIAKVNPLRCFVGSGVATGLSFLIYRLFVAIALTFANKPITSTNVTAINIGAAVRTLVMGGVTLGAGVFGVAALGLFALGVQLTVQRLRGQNPPSTQKMDI